MPHLLIAGKLHPAGLALLNGVEGTTYDYVEEVSEQSYAPLIGKADALSSAPSRCRLRLLARPRGSRSSRATAWGTISVDVATLNARRIPLCIVGDVNSLSVAEHAMMLILACAKFLSPSRSRGAHWSVGLAQPAGGSGDLG